MSRLLNKTVSLDSFRRRSFADSICSIAGLPELAPHYYSFKDKA